MLYTNHLWVLIRVLHCEQFVIYSAYTVPVTCVRPFGRGLIVSHSLTCAQPSPAGKPLTICDVIVNDYVAVLIENTHIATEMNITNNLIQFSIEGLAALW